MKTKCWPFGNEAICFAYHVKLLMQKSSMRQLKLIIASCRVFPLFFSLICSFLVSEGWFRRSAMRMSPGPFGKESGKGVTRGRREREGSMFSQASLPWHLERARVGSMVPNVYAHTRLNIFISWQLKMGMKVIDNASQLLRERRRPPSSTSSHQRNWKNWTASIHIHIFTFVSCLGFFSAKRKVEHDKQTNETALNWIRSLV